jgi:hypothetical protein
MVGMKTLNNLQLLILKFNFVIEYKERWRNTVADALSRAQVGGPMGVITRSGRMTADHSCLQRGTRRQQRGGERRDERQQQHCRESSSDQDATSRARLGSTYRRSRTRTKRLRWSKKIYQLSLAKGQGKGRLGDNNVSQLLAH